MSYENAYARSESAVHKDKVFDYGYVGKFERRFLDTSFAYNYSFDPAFVDPKGQTINSYTYTGRSEVPLVFTPGTQNPDAA